MARPAFDRSSFLDSTFLIAESTTNHMHIAGTATYEAGPLRAPTAASTSSASATTSRRACTCHPAVPPGAGLHADRGPPGVGGRPALQHPLPRAPHRAAAARRRAAAEAPLGPHHVAAARPLEAAVGDLGRRGARGRRPLRHDHQDPPLHGRRHVERRPARGAAHARVRRTPSSRTPRWIPRPAPTTWELLRAETVAPRLAAARDPVDAPPVDQARAGSAVRHPRDAARGARHGVDRPAHGVGHAAQPADRPAPPLRLAGDEPRRGEGGQEPPRRHAQRRRARHRRGRGAALPEDAA